LRDDNSF
jgi:predicted  nucleic acid-binding Zn-ribbon protein